MTKNRTLPNFDSSSSKQEEIDALFAIAECFKPGTYLNNFFTPALMNWLEQTVRDDFNPDLMEAYQKTGKETTDLLNRLQEAQRRLEDEKRARQADNLEREKEVARLNDQLDEFNKALDSTLAERREALDRAFELERELERAKGEIVRLKAQLYDLMTAK